MRHFWGTIPARRLSNTTTPHATTPTSSVRQRTSMAGTTPVTRHYTCYGTLHPYEALHPLRGTTPRTRRCTRYEALHPLRSDAPDQKGCTAYGSGAVPPITRTNAESARRSPIRTRPRKHAQFDEVLRRRERDTHQAPGARAPGASTVTPQTAATSQTGARAPGAAAQSQLSRRSTSRRRGRR